MIKFFSFLSFILFFFMQSSCALLLITEPDERTLKFQEKSAKGKSCTSCKDSKNTKERDAQKGFSASQDRYKKSQSAKAISRYRYQLKSARSDAARTRAATELGMYDSLALDAVPDLEHAAINDKSKWVRRASIKSLYKIGSHSSLGVIRTATKDRDHYVKKSAEEAMNKWNNGKRRARFQ